MTRPVLKKKKPIRVFSITFTRKKKPDCQKNRPASLPRGQCGAEGLVSKIEQFSDVGEVHRIHCLRFEANIGQRCRIFGHEQSEAF